MGYFVGFSDTVGHKLTFQIYLPHTGKIVDQSAVRSAILSDTWNLRAASKAYEENNSNPKFEGEGKPIEMKPKRNIFQKGQKLL